MCGIFGLINFNQSEVKKADLRKMESAIASRGPDEKRFYLGQNLGLGMNRLSILDLEHGSQPFTSDDENIIVFQNGEIYNFKEIQVELKKQGFLLKTNCDTEVILRSYEFWGEEFVNKLNGMFVIVIYDRSNKKVKIYRDRVGVKPVYYYLDSKRFIFASEIKSILQMEVKKQLCYESLSKGFLYGYIPCPDTIFKNIKHVQPGTVIEVTLDGKLTSKKWWHISEYLQQKVQKTAVCEEKIEDILKSATEIRLRSDVEVGAFLSGGLDSSYVVGLASKLSSDSLRTYSIGFQEEHFDETPHALEVSRMFGTNHKVDYLTPKDVDLWKQVTYLNDQPHSDVSFIPTFRVAEMASKDLKVVLSGDGGDEVFAGYDKYHFLEKSSLNGGTGDFQDYVHSRLHITDINVLDSLYSNSNLSEFSGFQDHSYIDSFDTTYRDVDPINKGLLFDMLHLMPSNNLVKPDRMGMANSLEVRSPFLDYRLIEYVFGLPGSYKIQNGEKKYILKKIAEPLLGKSLTYRKKQMFTVPVGEWFKKDLSQFLLEKLNSKNFQGMGILNLKIAHNIINEHISGSKNHTRLIRFLISLVYHIESFFSEEK